MESAQGSKSLSCRTEARTCSIALEEKERASYEEGFDPCCLTWKQIPPILLFRNSQERTGVSFLKKTTRKRLNRLLDLPALSVLKPVLRNR